MKAIFFEGEIQDNYIGHIMAEVYKEQLYAPFLVGKKDLTILDIGANIGITAQYFANFGKVYSVEPAKEHFNCLFEMIKYNKLEDKITPINKALFMNNDKYPFFHNKNRTMYSLHSAVSDGSSEPEEVSCISLDKLFEEYEIDHVDMMKLDVEGSEVEILSSEGFRNVCEKIDTIIIERHAWSGRNPNQILEVLKMRGFIVEKIQAEADILVARR
jgi:FkbM family methyltransferase